jgi:hypothetical protein
MPNDPQTGIDGNLEHVQKRPAVVTGLLVLLVMLGMGLRLYELDADSLWTDEIITAEQAQQDLSSVLNNYRDDNYTHPPLVDLVTRFFITLAGNTEFVIRAQAMLFGSLTILLIYKVGETLWNRGVGLVGGALLTVNAYHVHYSQEARSYALMVFLALLCLFFLWRALHKNKKRYWLGFIICASLSLYNHYFAALFMPAVVVLAACVIGQNWSSLRRREGRDSEDHTSQGPSLPARQSLWLLLSLAVVGLSYVPWLPALRTHIAFFTGYQGQAVATVERLQSSLGLLDNMLRDYSGVSGVALLLWVGVFVLGFASCDRKRMALVASWIGAPFVLLAFVRSGYPSKPRYVLFILPLLLLLVARGITSGARALAPHLPAARGQREWLVPSMVTLTVLIFVSLSVAPLSDYYSWQKDDWRGAARYLADNMEPGDVVIVDGISYRPNGDSETADLCLSYYLAQYGREDAPILQVRRGLWEEIQGLGESERGAWAVAFHHNRPSREEKTEGVTVVSFPHVSIAHLDEASGRLLENGESLLHVLLDLFGPAEGSFEVHLALAEFYCQAGDHGQAASHIVAANLVTPDSSLAVADLADASARLQPFTHIRLEVTGFGDSLSLAGYSIDIGTVTAGDVVDMTLSWQAVGKMDRDYTVFVHLLDEFGRIWAQEDPLLTRGRRPTSQWVVGGTGTNRHYLRTRPDTPPGEYAIRMGVYYWKTGERLEVWDSDTGTVIDDSISLGSITVVD